MGYWLYHPPFCYVGARIYINANGVRGTDNINGDQRHVADDNRSKQTNEWTKQTNEHHRHPSRDHGRHQPVHTSHEIETGPLADPLNQPIDCRGREWAAALSLEDEAPVVLRWSSRSARNSSPGIGWADGVPLLALRTCRVGLRPHSTCDHSKSAISLARRPCRNGAIRESW